MTATPPLLRHDFVRAQLSRLRDHFDGLAGTGVTTTDGVTLSPAALRAVHDHLQRELDAPESPSAAYYPSSPVISVLQSAMHDQLARKRAAGESVSDEEPGDPFTDQDIKGWIGDVGLSLIGRILHPSHRFCDAPARLDLGPRARLIMFADWGTGRAKARDVADRAREHVVADRPVHFVHLGDTYYSGTPAEARRNILDCWPVRPGEEDRIGSWALNGNHDMYCGGHGLFETTLTDPRFARQWAGGHPTSWAHLTTGGWNVLGLDTAWNNRILRIEPDGRLGFCGQVGHLQGSQASLFAQCSRDGRRMLVLSHHQLFSAYDERNRDTTPMAEALADTLRRRPVDAWFWGHEHFCLGYEPFGGVDAARVIGHGAVPTDPLTGPASPVGRDPVVVKPSVDGAAAPALRAVSWEYRGTRTEADGTTRARHGFVVVDLDDDRLHAEYFDDEGRRFLTEDL